MLHVQLFLFSESALSSSRKKRKKALGLVAREEEALRKMAIEVGFAKVTSESLHAINCCNHLKT